MKKLSFVLTIFFVAALCIAAFLSSNAEGSVADEVQMI